MKKNTIKNEEVINEEVSKVEAKNQELIALIKKGDNNALSKLCFLNQKFVYSIMMLKTRNNKLLSQDLTQDVLIKMVTSITQYNTVEYKFRNWLSSIISSVFIDHIRYEKSRVEVRSNSVDFSAEGMTEDSVDTRFNYLVFNAVANKSVEHDYINGEIRDNIKNAVLAGIASLSNEKQRKAIELHLNEDLTYVEISEQIDATLTNTKALLFRAKLGILKHIISGRYGFAGDKASQRIIKLGVVEEKSSADIAKIMKCSEAKVEDIINEGLKKIFTNCFYIEESTVS